MSENCSECRETGAESARIGEGGKPTWLHGSCLLKIRAAERTAELARDRAWHYSNHTSSRDRLIERRKALQTAGLDTRQMTDEEINERSQEITNEHANA